MYMKAGDPFTGNEGQKYEKDGEIAYCDLRIAYRLGWMPADAPAPVIIVEEKPKK